MSDIFGYNRTKWTPIVVDPNFGGVVVAKYNYLDKRLDSTSGDLDYMGVSLTHKAATSDTTWIITKFTWTAGTLVRIEGPLEGSWDGRAALDWA